MILRTEEWEEFIKETKGEHQDHKRNETKEFLQGQTAGPLEGERRENKQLN